MNDKRVKGIVEAKVKKYKLKIQLAELEKLISELEIGELLGDVDLLNEVSDVNDLVCVVNKGDKYHKMDCISVNTCTSGIMSNYRKFEAISIGFKSCSKCKS